MVKFLSLNEKCPSTDFHQMVDIILHSAQVMANLFCDFLDAVQFEYSKIIIVPRKMPLNQIVERIHSVFDSEVSRLGVVLNVVMNPNVPSVMTSDSNRITQVLTHLLCNSFRAMVRSNDEFHSTSGVITLMISMANNDLLQFEITDNGCGIPQEEQANLFSPFYQRKQAAVNVNNVPGCGLGLFLCKKLVETMGYILLYLIPQKKHLT